jgi:hypothetical protein
VADSLDSGLVYPYKVGLANMAKASFTRVGNSADSCGRHHLTEQQLLGQE